MLERKIFEDQGVIPAVKFVTAAASLEVYEQCVRATANPTTGAYAITLPAVAQAAGKFFAIHTLDADQTNKVTVQDRDDSENWADLTLDAGANGCLLYSDGRRWWVVVSDLTPATGTPTTT